MKLNSNPITTILSARDAYDAEIVNILYSKVINEDLPSQFACPKWTKSIKKYPVELYLLFQSKRKLTKFMKMLAEETTAVTIISKSFKKEEN